MNLGGELRAWWEAACCAMPGAAGYALRRHLAARHAAAVGEGMVLARGLRVNGWANLRLGARVGIGLDCIVEAKRGTVEIGDDCRFNSRVTLGADFGRIVLGRQVIVGMNVVMRAANHRFDRSPELAILAQGHEPGEIAVGDDVWIGAGAILLAGARIGSHCVIGAGAVVAGEIPSGSLAVGAPARVVRTLGPGPRLASHG